MHIYYFNYGEGKRLLDNAVISIYRKHFTLEEINAIVAFYRSPAGEKLARDFPVIMLQSLKAAAMVKEKLKN